MAQDPSTRGDRPDTPPLGSGADPDLAVMGLVDYLSDKVAPLLVADSIELLLQRPPELTAKVILSWATEQTDFHQNAFPISDFFYHSFKKVHLLGDLNLISDDELKTFLEALAEIILDYCPEDEKRSFIDNVTRLGEKETSLISTVQLLHRSVGTDHWLPVDADTKPPKDIAGAPGERRRPGVPPAAPSLGAGPSSEGTRSPTPEDNTPPKIEIRSAKARDAHFLLLLDRLENRSREVEGTPEQLADVREQMASQLLMAAADGADNDQEFGERIEQLRQAGLDKLKIGQFFDSLARTLPNWSLPTAQSSATNLSAPMHTMQKLILLAKGLEETIQRLQSMVVAAVEMFNSGSLGRAVTMLELAERLIHQGELPVESASVIRKAAQDKLDLALCRELANDPRKHPPLRRMLNFFPDFRLDKLIEAVELEEHRQERHKLLSLIKAHGPSARRAATAALIRSLARPTDEWNWYFQRNMLYILRHVPAPPTAPDEREIAATVRLSALDQPAPLVREAIALLGQIGGTKADRSLRQRLQELDTVRNNPEDDRYDNEEVDRLLSLTLSTLIRSGTLGARRTAIRHLLDRDLVQDFALEILHEAGAFDLSDDPATVERLIKILRTRLPAKLLGVKLGFIAARAQHEITALITALASTPTPAVRKVMSDVFERFPNEKFAERASDALARFDHAGSKSVLVPSLEGDLEVFALPELAQNLANTLAQGILTLNSRADQRTATIVFKAGRVADCQAGGLKSREAFYYLLQKPFASSFQFVSIGPDEDVGKTHDAIALIIEGMRRYDEYQRARTIVPDDMTIAFSKLDPTASEQETEEDGAFIRAIWEILRSGATPVECEERIAAEPYRVRSLIAHWISSGAIVAAA